MRRISNHIVSSFQVRYRNPLIRKILRKACLASLLIISVMTAEAQFPDDTTILDVSKVNSFQAINQALISGPFKKNEIPGGRIPDIRFFRKIPSGYGHKIPLDMIGKTVVLRFYLYNGADSIERFFFTAGLYCETIELFKASQDNIRLDYLVNNTGPAGFELIRLAPKEKALFFAKLNFVRTVSDILAPKIIKADFLPYFKPGLPGNNDIVNLLNYIIAGVLLMMIFYSISVYLQNYSVEFL
jgi:hypothetical protein